MITYYAQSGDSITRYDSVYVDNYSQVLCISHNYGDNGRAEQHLYFGNDILVKYRATNNSLDTLMYPPYEYLASNLDGFIEDRVVKWEANSTTSGADTIDTYRMQSDFQVVDNPLGIDGNTPLDVTNYYKFRSIPDVNDYNIPALRALGVVVTWDFDDQNIPVMFSDFCTKTKISLSSQTEIITKKHRTTAVSSVIESSISRMKAKLLERFELGSDM